MLTVALSVVVGVAVFAALMAGFHWRGFLRTRLVTMRARLGASERDELALFTNQKRSWLERLLAESGSHWKKEQVVQACVGGAAAGLVAGLALGGLGLSLLGAAVGAAVMPLTLTLQRDERLRKCDQQLPQALRLVTLSLRAGQALPSALALAAREGPAPLKHELKLSVDEAALGVDIGTVFEHLAARLVRCESARTLCVAVRVLEQTGGNLITVIDNIIDSARARTQYQAKLSALTAEGRWSAWILGSMPPGFFVLAGLLDPTYWPTLFGDLQGWVVLAVGTAMWLLGVWWTQVIVKSGQQVAMS